MVQLSIQFRVILALVLREARVRYGRSKLGYLWAIIDPVFIISILSLLFSAFRDSPPHGDFFLIFFTTGVLPFQYFRNCANFVGMSFFSNRNLFNYPVVHPMDAVFARMILETATTTVVVVIVITGQIVVFGVNTPHDIAYMTMVFFLAGLLGFGAGLCNAVIQRVFPSWKNFFSMIMGPAFFVSGIIHTLVSVPTYYRQFLVWNPIIHGVEGFRNGYYPDYPSFDIDLGYLFWFGFTLTFVGFVAERIVRREPS